MQRCALISVTDKVGVVEFASDLVRLGFRILSTGGTFRALRAGGVEATEIADYTGFPELMEGRLKTLHPRVHGGILARRQSNDDQTAMREHGISAIDVVAVNLYPFRETVRRPDVTRDEVIENIDIGGPAMLRSAAKNHAYVAVVVDPSDYPRLIESLQGVSGAEVGALDVELRRDLAGKAFAHTAAYDVAIAGFFESERAWRPGARRFGSHFGLAGDKIQDLRYGENPHQAAAFFRDPDARGPSLATARQRCGKELSYNNILDLDAALAVAAEFEEPACAIVKHNNPCGAAQSTGIARAFIAALESDPVSAFGGIVALNRRLDIGVATAMVEAGTFLEAIVAPHVDAEAIEILRGVRWGESVRVLELGGMPEVDELVGVRPVSGGFLVQSQQPRLQIEEERVVSRRHPGQAELATLRFAMRVCKYVKSNAIVLAAASTDGTLATVGVGAGQMSRVDSVRIAVAKAEARAAGSVLASDAFFPFADGATEAGRAGVVAIIQPGGSRRDAEVIAAADAAGMAMVFTGVRHFRH